MKLSAFIHLADPAEYAAIARAFRSPILYVSLTLGLAILGAAWVFGVLGTSHLPWLSCLVVLLSLLTAVDTREHMLPDALTIPGTVLGLAYALFLSDSLVWHILATALGFGLFFGVAWGNKVATGQWGMGFGDAKLLALIGAWGGLWVLLPTILVSSVFATIVAYSKRLRKLPYGPFLAAAGFASLLWFI